MKDQPGLFTNLPWLLNDENTLEDETKREWNSQPGRSNPEGVYAYSVIPRRHAPRQFMGGRVCSAVPGHAVQLQIDNFVSYSLYYLTTQIER